MPHHFRHASLIFWCSYRGNKMWRFSTASKQNVHIVDSIDFISFHSTLFMYSYLREGVYNYYQNTRGFSTCRHISCLRFAHFCLPRLECENDIFRFLLRNKVVSSRLTKKILNWEQWTKRKESHWWQPLKPFCRPLMTESHYRCCLGITPVGDDSHSQE